MAVTVGDDFQLNAFVRNGIRVDKAVKSFYRRRNVEHDMCLALCSGIKHALNKH